MHRNTRAVIEAGRALGVDVHPREYPDGTLAIFHGPRLLARYTGQADPINSAPQKLAA